MRRRRSQAARSVTCREVGRHRRVALYNLGFGLLSIQFLTTISNLLSVALIWMTGMRALFLPFLIATLVGLTSDTQGEELKVGDSIVVCSDRAVLLGEGRPGQQLAKATIAIVRKVESTRVWIIAHTTVEPIQGWITRSEVVPLRKALPCVNEVLAGHPSSSAYVARGRVYYANRETEKAIADFSEALRRSPKSAEAYYLRGLASLRLANFDNALQDFTEVTKLQPTNADAFFGCATAWKRKGDDARAILDFAEASSLDPSDPAALNELAWISATSRHSQCRYGLRAVQMATKACELSGWKNGLYLDTLAVAYAETGDFKSAVMWATKALDLSSAEWKSEISSHLRGFKAGHPLVDTAHFASPVPRDKTAFTIAVGSNRYSYLEWNGCSSTQFGGIDRELCLLEAYRKERNNSVMYIATGTTFITNPALYDRRNHADYVAKATFVADALNLIGARYCAASVNDLALGLDTIAALNSRARFRFLSANLARVGPDGKRQLLFDAFGEQTIGGTRVVVVGMSGLADPRYDVPKDVDVVSPKEALGAIWSKVSTPTAFVILAGSLSEAERNDILKAFPAIALILGGSEGHTLDLEMIDQRHAYVNPDSRGTTTAIIEVAPTLPFSGYFSPRLADFARDRSQWLEKQLQLHEHELSTNGVSHAQAIQDQAHRRELLNSLKRRYAIDDNPSASHIVFWTKHVSDEFDSEGRRFLRRLRDNGLSQEGASDYDLLTKRGRASQ